MKAIQIRAHGGPEALQAAELPMPEPEPDQALVRVEAAGVNFIDVYHRTGLYAVNLPYVPGQEGAGTVEAVGGEVTGLAPGDRVAWAGVAGAYAEYARVPAGKLVKLPEHVDCEQAAAAMLQGMTAHYLTHDTYPLKRGDTALVHAAAGGVGLLLVQWAKHKGARVIGTVSTEEKAKIARDAGADEVIIYTQQDFVAETKKLTGGRGADYIIDGVGQSTFAKDLEAVRARGHICIFGSASGPAEPFAPNSLMARSLTVSGGMLFNYVGTREELLSRARSVLNGMRQGWLKLRIDKVLPLEKAAEAHRLLEGRQTRGKVILKIGG